MAKKLKRALALALTAVLCAGSIPAIGLEETLQTAEEQVATVNMPSVLYRAHRMEAQQPDDDSEQSPSMPLDSLEIELDDGTAGIFYRVRSNAGEWQDEWAQDGNPAVTDAGIAVLQVCLSDELAMQYDVWYRMCTQDDGWLGWAQNGEDAGSEVSPVVDFEVILQQKGEAEPDQDQEANETDTSKPLPFVAAPITEEEADTNSNATAENDTTVPENDTEVVDVQVDQNETVASIQDAAKGTSTKSANNTVALKTQADASVTYRAHVQQKGWMKWVSNGKTAGTNGKSLRVEGIRIKLKNVDGGIRYKTHVQNIGWQGWKSNGKMSGTSGKKLRLEAIRIELTGNAAKEYDVYYRAHVQKLGWLAWAKNGEDAGTSSFGYRMEAIQVKLVKHGDPAPSNANANLPVSHIGNMTVRYAANLNSGGWQKTKKNGKTAGKANAGTRIKQVKANLASTALGRIRYSVCSNGGSWQGWQYDGSVAGTSGKNINAIRFKLTGNMKKHYNVWYRVYVTDVGWLDWTKNGKSAGSNSKRNPIEAIRVKVLPKSSAAPGNTKSPYYHTAKSGNHLDGVDISGWQKGINTASLTADFVIIKATEGYDGTIYNPGYKTMANDAINSGKLIGFYHYANGLDAKKEAKVFYDAIKSYKGRAISVLDWEGQGNSKFETGVDVQWCKTFLDELKRLYGGTPFLYTSKNVTNGYDWSSVAKTYPLWGAEYAYADVVYQGYLSSPWQSSNPWGAWGSVAKIHQYGFVNPKPNNGGYDELDADIFYGTESDWKSYQ